MSKLSAALRAAAGSLLAIALCLPVQGAFAAATTVIGTVPQRGQIAQHGGLVAVTQLEGDGTATLAIGSRLAPPRAIETRRLPAWGQPHVGTSEIGSTVIVYPHCHDVSRPSTCNLWAFDVTFGKDAALTGEAARRGTGEIEGDMDRGALAFTRWTAPKAKPGTLSLGGKGDANTQLFIQPFGQPARPLSPPGGQQIDLDRGRVAQVRDRDPAPGCDAPVLEVVTVATGKVATIAHHGCRHARHTYLAPTLFGTQVVWGLRTPTTSVLERHPARGGAGRGAEVVPFAVIAPAGPDSAYELRGDTAPALGSEPARLRTAWTFALSEGLAMH
jgi:hypothetical protein